MRPLLLLDVDGPLNPYRAKAIPPGYVRHEIVEGEKTWVVLLNPQHGVELNTLAGSFELVWATTWEHGANRLLGPLLGLPELPVIIWPPRESMTRTRRGSWKTPYIAEWAADRAFAWVDDEVNRYDRFYLDNAHGPAHLAHRVEPHVGLTAADFAVLKGWAENPLRTR
ncbi:HAD domain-containing protein [Kribbella sp. NPDC058245]|uniref:HAD domain-containing protein n=1 Tax=Kribbella sp. NPDC058245 TaxID=3346399 RepID=UPI0036E26384